MTDDTKATAEPVEDPQPADEPITLEVQNLKINVNGKWAQNG